MTKLNFTSKATADFVTTRFAREDKSGMETIAAGIVWGLHNPSELNEVLAGKTPQGWKALRTQVAEGSTEARARHWSTDTRKAMTLVLMSDPELSADNLPDTLSEAVACIVDMLGVYGSNASALRQAHKAATAPAAPVVAVSEETEEGAGDGAGVEDSRFEEEPVTDTRGAVEQVADLLKDMLDHGMGGNSKQGDIAQIVQFCIANASDATLSQMAQSVNEELVARMDAQELANAA